MVSDITAANRLEPVEQLVGPEISTIHVHSSPLAPHRFAMISEQFRAFLAALPSDNMPPGVHNELLQLLGVAESPSPDDALAKESRSDIQGDSAPSTSSSGPLEDVRQSFMKMAPQAFELGNMMYRNVVNRLKPLSQEQQMDLWTKVWESFDFNDCQRINVGQEWDEL